MSVDPSCIAIDLSRDALFDDFAITTLKERYMLPGETSPQHALARAAAAFADDEAHAQRLYDYSSKHWFMFATPLLSNGGSTRGLPISCFLTTVEDSLGAIFDHYKEVAFLSAKGGGVGSYYGNLRSMGEGTSKGSASSGVMPWAAIDDRVILGVSQGGTRRGSHAIYLDVHHPEIEEFCTSRKSGGDANRKTLNLHNAICITDEFMRAVKNDTDFYLRDPNSHRITKTLRARDLWRLILETRMQTGEPYLFFVDTANRALPASQKKKGLRVHHSNLCVGGATELLTDHGYRPIQGLVDRSVRVWNGLQFSPVTVRQTSERSEMVRVWFEDGAYLDCTPYHKFYDEAGRENRAGALKSGTVLEDGDHPVLGLGDAYDKTQAALAYAAGWASFCGYEEDNRLSVFVPAESGFGMDDALTRLASVSVDMRADLGFDSLEQEIKGTTIRFEPRTIQAGLAPLGWKLHERKAWLGGALDGVGEWIDIDGVPYLSMASPDRDMVLKMRLVALSCGLNPRIRLTEELSAFMLDSDDVDTGLSTDVLRQRVDWTYDYRERQSVVVDVQPLPFKAATYCFEEPLRHRGTFNGILTGNCTEITLATGRDDLGNKRTAVCCLSSVNYEKWPEWAMIGSLFVEDLMRMLDNCLHVFIQTAPPEMKDSVYSALMERSVGLGGMGFHSYLQRMGVAFESEEARAINVEQWSRVRHWAEMASLKLGEERGEAPDMAGTGQRFAHKLAQAPNASSSILCGGISPAGEPNRANAFLHKTLSGTWTVCNKYLKAALAQLDLDTDAVWKSIMAHKGSIQHLDLPALLKDVYKTATELDQRWTVQHALDRTDLLCQGQSINLFIESLPAEASAEAYEALAAYVSELHFMAWNEGDGVKSLYYLRSTAPMRAESVNTQVARKVMTDAPAFDLGALVSEAHDSGAFVAEASDCVACEG